MEIGIDVNHSEPMELGIDANRYIGSLHGDLIFGSVILVLHEVGKCYRTPVIILPVFVNIIPYSGNSPMLEYVNVWLWLI